MWKLNYDSQKEIMAVMKLADLAMSRKFGQNFLIDHASREKIVQVIAPEEGMDTWEIGPGLGAITSLMLEKGANVHAFEIDHGFCSLLREQAFADEEKFTLIEGDALKTLFSSGLPTPERIYGNLPYNVGSVCIAKLIENGVLPPRMVFTLQKEVAQRMCASPSDPSFSSFSLLTELDYDNSIVQIIRKGCFFPEPQVESAVIVMQRRQESRIPASLRPIFLPLIRDLFAQRRKNVKNNLLSSFVGKQGGKEAVAQVLATSGFTGLERAEDFTWDELLVLTRAVSLL